MVASGGHVWLLRGGMHGCSGGSMCGCSGGVCGCSGRHAWLLPGGMHGCSRGMSGCSGGACVVAPRGGMHGIRWDTEIWSMSRRYASYWNAFLFIFCSTFSIFTPCLIFSSLIIYLKDVNKNIWHNSYAFKTRLNIRIDHILLLLINSIEAGVTFSYPPPFSSTHEGCT